MMTEQQENKIKELEDQLNSYPRRILIASIVCIAFLVGGFIWKSNDLMFFCASFVTGGFLFCILSEKKETEQKLYKVKYEYDKYLVQQRKAYEKQQEEFKEMQRKREAEHPVCPTCGSKRTKKITTANRAVSIGMVGLASSKIGKQFECDNCKFKW